ncbi:hypothetical protein Pla86_15100 [Planctomycetes bacterium Pla86]|uniref:Uncharacterized protein n=1 Tax=Engelhardtia mirabilis TaxID=2528011 RepID=A0A518BHH8_9BACT|nr:hypothetical protein Pla133_15110 [Planctomycetes bacterium Pla133]QDV00763.1 hypothetical protein Pla86_15100 [Planctomycetes bacterium Pla86]
MPDYDRVRGEIARLVARPPLLRGQRTEEPNP